MSKDVMGDWVEVWPLGLYQQFGGLGAALRRGDREGALRHARVIVNGMRSRRWRRGYAAYPRGSYVAAHVGYGWTKVGAVKALQRNMTHGSTENADA